MKRQRVTMVARSIWISGFDVSQLCRHDDGYGGDVILFIQILLVEGDGIGHLRV